MLANNDIIQIVTHMVDTSRDIPFDNVFHFRAFDVEGVIEDPADLGQIAADWFIGLHAVLSVYQANVISWVSADFENLTNLIDIGSYNPDDPLAGAVSSAPEPAYVALSFQYVRGTRVTRHGSKRFSGIADTLLTDGSGQALEGTADMVALQDYLLEDWEAVVGTGLEATFTPVIVRRPATGLPVSVYNSVADVVFRGAGSQNSRKRLL